MEHIQGTPDHDMEFVGGAVCLDFTNTIGGTRERPTHEHLGGYADLVSFARAAGTLSPAQAKQLLAEAGRQPRIATEVYRRGLVLREAVSRAFADIAHRRAPADDDIALIGREAAASSARSRMTRGPSGFAWAWPDDDLDLSRPLWPVARSAAELLTDDQDRVRVRECGSETCTWLFVDRSRNHSRRWCDMNDCGNRAKARRFRQRQARAARKAR